MNIGKDCDCGGTFFCRYQKSWWDIDTRPWAAFVIWFAIVASVVYQFYWLVPR